MADMNIVAVTGHLSRDAELQATQTGTSILRFGMGVNRSRKAQDGSWEDVPNWVDVVVFGRYAESLEGKLFKGMKVAVSGELRYSAWERDGQKRSKLEVVANSVQFLSQPQSGSQGQYAPQMTNYPPQGQSPAYGQQTAPQGYQPPMGDIYSDDIPFN